MGGKIRDKFIKLYTMLTGYFNYHSINEENYACMAMQHDNAFDAFKELLQEVRPSQILEVGTAGGGTTLFLREYLNEIGLNDTRILSLDVVEQEWTNGLRERDITVDTDNVFDYSTNTLIRPDAIVPFIQREGTTIVLCDGGNKISEFITLSPYLKIGDIIMAHDYVDTVENFHENFVDKIWNWREIGDEHITEAVIQNNLEPFMQNLFTNVVWVCKVKRQNG